MKKILLRVLFLVCVLALLAPAASAEWKKSQGRWQYYGDDGKKVTDFRNYSSVTVPDEVDSLEHGTFVNISREFVLKVEKGSYAEQFAKQYGYQYDNGEKQVVGYQIDDLEEKAGWIIENYVEDNYKGGELTELEKAKVLHDWLTTNATYDCYGLDVEVREHTFSAEGVLLDGTGVCDSYAQAYSYLLNKANILNRYIAGDTTGELNNTNHAWNLVMVDGQWYFTDVTWDDPGGETAENAPVTTGWEGYDYFLLTDGQLTDNAHNAGRIWDDRVSADDNVVGFVFTDEGTYYYGDVSDTAEATVGWVDVEHNSEYSDGYYWLYNPTTNWKQYENEGRYYFTEDGTMAVGWEKIANLRYYFDYNGIMHVGWLTEEEGRYHFSETGAMDTGWLDMMEDYYSYNDDTGEWEIKTGSFTYYFGNDGKMYVGFIDANGKTYYLNKDSGRMEKDAWIEDGSDKYHAGADGALDKGFTNLTEDYLQWNPETEEWDLKTGTFTYYFEEDGKMYVGFIDANGETYHLSDNGRMEKDAWFEDGSAKYHAGTDGSLDKGFTNLAGDYAEWNPDIEEWEWKTGTFTYYFGDDGKMYVGFIDANGKTYYLSKDNGRMEKNTWIEDGPDKYHAGADGSLDKGFTNLTEDYLQWNPDTQEWDLKTGTFTYYFDKNGQMHVGWCTTGGETYYLSKDNGRMEKGFVTVDDTKYYFDQEGKMQTGLFRVDGTLHYAEKDGELTDDLTDGFVARCYQVILGREADTNGLKNWSQRLKSGASTAAEIVSGFVNSPEFHAQNNTSEETVEVLYNTMLGRGSDPGGRANWASYLDSGCSDGAVINGFCGSQEFLGICDEFQITPGSVAQEARDYNKNLTAFVDRCYTEALDRGGEPGGLNYWCGEIISGTRTPVEVASGFVFSQEMENRNMSDGEVIDMLYRLYLGRPADEGGREYWVQQMQNGMTMEQLNDGFAYSVEFADIVQSYGLE